MLSVQIKTLARLAITGGTRKQIAARDDMIMFTNAGLPKLVPVVFMPVMVSCCAEI